MNTNHFTGNDYTLENERARLEPLAARGLLYPCSWALTAIAEILYFIHCYKQAMKIFREPIPSSL